MREITVLLPVYNAECFLRECLESIIQQTYPDFELIACDDGSKDSSLKILQEYALKDNRITILKNEENKGIVYTRNRLLDSIPQISRFVAWIDSDDVCFPDRLERQRNYLIRNPETAGVSSCLEIINEHSQITGYCKYPCNPEIIRKKMPGRNVLAQPALMLRREVIAETGKISPEYKVCEDYEYYLRILEKHDFANLPEPVIKYRISKEQTKQRLLKPTLRNTIAIQKRFFQRQKRPRPLAILFRHLAYNLLLLLPSRVILSLFCLLTYKKK